MNLKNFFRILFIFGWCTTVFFTPSLLAQEHDSFDESESESEIDIFSLSLQDLMNITVISATRSESTLRESPVPMSVITAEQIASSGLDNIADILGLLPEIDVMHISPSQVEVSIRGKNINFNRRLLVLIDGRTEYNDLFGATFWNAMPIAVDDISRIEVIRGPASALFGANAYAGVVNIISKSPEEKSKQLARAHIGSDGFYYGYLALNYALKDHYFRLSYHRRNVDNSEQQVIFAGFNQFPSSVDFAWDKKSLQQMQGGNFQYLAKLNTNLQVEFIASISDGLLELIPQPGLPRDNWDINSNNIQLKLEHTLDKKGLIQFNGYRNRFKYQTFLLPLTDAVTSLAVNNIQAFFPSIDEPSQFNGTVTTDDVSLQYVSNEDEHKLTWLVGTQYRKINNKGGLVINKGKEIRSLFANFTYKFSEDNWIFAMAVRLDNDSMTQTDIAYNTSLQHFLNATDDVRFTLRRAFRAPSLFELFNNIDINVPNQNHRVRFRGNPQLNVEIIDAIDLTYTTQLTSKLQLTTELFYEVYTDLIGNPDSGLLNDVDLTPDTNLFTTTTSFQNLTNANNQGLQASLLWLASDSFKFNVHYRFTKPSQLNALSGETFFTPKHTVKMLVNWQVTPSVASELSWQFIDKTEPSEFNLGNVTPDGFNFTRANQQSWTELNLSLRYQPKHFTDIEIYIMIKNVLDDKRIEYFEYDAVLNGVGEQFGRRFWSGFTWQF
ncbi:MAG: TonB-dependent receptor plug domain-containing protein [Colwellia sp.]|nr:TonB-dependent receptor plug domain-containing protein [Colwellia sp.]